MAVHKHLKKLARLVVVGLILATTAIPIVAQTYQKKMALVIGNDRYQFLSDLKNPQFDANAISQTLSSLDFTVYLAHNLTQSQTEKAVAYFNSRAEDADVALVYFAGHGARVSGVNYLFATDFNPTTPFDSKTALSFSELQAELSRGLRSNVFLIDACQDDPFLSEETETNLIAAERLSPQNPPIGSSVTFASTSGSAAYDGTQAHSIFTGALLDNLQTKGIDLEAMLRNVRRDVIVTSGSQQVPQTLSTLVTQIQFNANQDQLTHATNRSQTLSMAQTGVMQKPVLLDIALGLRPNLVKETEMGRRLALKKAICDALDGPIISQCLMHNSDAQPSDLRYQNMSLTLGR